MREYIEEEGELIIELTDGEEGDDETLSYGGECVGRVSCWMVLGETLEEVAVKN